VKFGVKFCEDFLELTLSNDRMAPRCQLIMYVIVAYCSGCSGTAELVTAVAYC
jgi:hypothetical protein